MKAATKKPRRAWGKSRRSAATVLHRASGVWRRWIDVVDRQASFRQIRDPSVVALYRGQPQQIKRACINRRP